MEPYPPIAHKLRLPDKLKGYIAVVYACVNDTIYNILLQLCKHPSAHRGVCKCENTLSVYFLTLLFLLKMLPLLP